MIRAGADDGTRTRNRRFTKPLLYQLSYVGARRTIPQVTLWRPGMIGRRARQRQPRSGSPGRRSAGSSTGAAALALVLAPVFAALVAARDALLPTAGLGAFAAFGAFAALGAFPVLGALRRLGRLCGLGGFGGLRHPGCPNRLGAVVGLVALVALAVFAVPTAGALAAVLFGALRGPGRPGRRGAAGRHGLGASTIRPGRPGGGRPLGVGRTRFRDRVGSGLDHRVAPGVA